MFPSLRYPTPQQDFIWLKRRQKVRPSELAESLEVTRPFISKAQRIAESRIRKLIRHTAAVNRINLKQISPRYGFAIGYCPGVQMQTYIVYSPELGVQTWYAHRGECNGCESHQICQETLKQLSEDWQIPLRHDLTPSDNAIVLFKQIQEELGWTHES